MPCCKCQCAECKPCVLPVPDAMGPYVACLARADGTTEVVSGATVRDALDGLCYRTRDEWSKRDE